MLYLSYTSMWLFCCCVMPVRNDPDPFHSHICYFHIDFCRRWRHTVTLTTVEDEQLPCSNEIDTIYHEDKSNWNSELERIRVTSMEMVQRGSCLYWNIIWDLKMRQNRNYKVFTHRWTQVFWVCIGKCLSLIYFYVFCEMWSALDW